MVDIFDKKRLLTDKEYTLTIVTDPASATCTLIHNGVSENTNSLTVKSGDIISYSIYHSTYGTATGTIIMDSDKTLTCTGKYSTRQIDTTWNQPYISSNGTIGSSSLAVSATCVSGSAYYWFDGNSNNYATGSPRGSSNPIIIYTSTPIAIRSFTITNWGGDSAGTRAFLTGSVLGSSNGSSYTTLTSFSNSTYTGNTSWTLSVGSSSYYNYHKIVVDTSRASSGYNQYIAKEISINATYQTTSYSYYWNKNIT